MKSLSLSYPDQLRLQRQGWIYSMIFHAIMGSCALALVSGLRMPLEPEQFQWNVSLVEPSKPHSTADTLPEVKPEPKPAPHTPRPVPSQPVLETVRQKVIQRVQAVPQVVQQRETPVIQTPSQITTVNQTASTIVTQSLQPSETSKTIAPVTAMESVVQEEQPVSMSPAVTQETATPVVTEPMVSQQAAEPVVQHAAIHTMDESTVRSQQPSIEQTIAQTAPAQTVPITKADYGWLVKALLGRIDQLKNYPHMARINHWEGKVILRAVIRDDGQVLMVDIQESSGRTILDNDAIETLRKASPLKLEFPLGKSQVAILMPISYALR